MNSLLPFPNGRDSGAGSFDVSDLLQEVAEHLEPHALRRGVEIELDAPPYAMAHADSWRLRQVFRSLLITAIDETSAGGEVVVTVYCDPELVEVEIAEGGAAMIDGTPAAADERQLALTRRRILEVRRLLLIEGAELELADCADGGAAYIVQLPGAAGAGAGRKAA